MPLKVLDMLFSHPVDGQRAGPIPQGLGENFPGDTGRPISKPENAGGGLAIMFCQLRFVTLALAGVLVLVVAIIGVQAWRRSRISPEERERERRAMIVASGKMGDANLVDLRDDLLFYSYGVRGVVYTATQDIALEAVHTCRSIVDRPRFRQIRFHAIQPTLSCCRRIGAGWGSTIRKNEEETNESTEELAIPSIMLVMFGAGLMVGAKKNSFKTPQTVLHLDHGEVEDRCNRRSETSGDDESEKDGRRSARPHQRLAEDPQGAAAGLQGRDGDGVQRQGRLRCIY